MQPHVGASVGRRRQRAAGATETSRSQLGRATSTFRYQSVCVSSGVFPAPAVVPAVHDGWPTEWSTYVNRYNLLSRRSVLELEPLELLTHQKYSLTKRYYITIGRPQGMLLGFLLTCLLSSFLW